MNRWWTENARPGENRDEFVPRPAPPPAPPVLGRRLIDDGWRAEQDAQAEALAPVLARSAQTRARAGKGMGLAVAQAELRAERELAATKAEPAADPGFRWAPGVEPARVKGPAFFEYRRPGSRFIPPKPRLRPVQEGRR